MKYRLPIVVALALFAVLSPAAAVAADEDPSTAANGPWISSIGWQDNDHVVATQSQGLLYRPAQVVVAATDSPEALEPLGEAETSLWTVLPLADGRVASSDYKGNVYLFGAGDPQKFELEARWIRALSLSPNPDQLLAGTEDGKLLLLSVSDLKQVRSIDAHKAAIFDIAISAAGDKVATASGDGSIKIFSWPELEQQAEMSVGQDAVWSVLFVNDDRQLVSGGADRRIQLWDVASAKSIVTIAMAHNWVTSLVALPESTLIAASCMDGSVSVVDYRTMHHVISQDGPGSAIWSLALSPDGSRLAAGTRKDGVALMEIGPWIEAGRTAAAEADAIRPPAPK